MVVERPPGQVRQAFTEKRKDTTRSTNDQGKLLLQYGEGKCGMTLQGCRDQIHHLRDISIKDIFSI